MGTTRYVQRSPALFGFGGSIPPPGHSPIGVDEADNLLKWVDKAGTVHITPDAGNIATVAGAVDGAAGFLIANLSDNTKQMLFDLSGQTTGKKLTVTSSQTADHTITIPNATDTLVGKATTDTLTNKTLTAPTLTAPSIGVATGTSFTATGLIKSSGTAGIGYATGAGGTQTQLTDKTTTTVLSKICGQITTAADALAGAGIVSFTLTNTLIAATDVMILNHLSGGTVGKYHLNAQCGAGSALITITNISAGSLSEAIVISFAVIKGVSA